MTRTTGIAAGGKEQLQSGGRSSFRNRGEDQNEAVWNSIGQQAAYCYQKLDRSNIPENGEELTPETLGLATHWDVI